MNVLEQDSRPSNDPAHHTHCLCTSLLNIRLPHHVYHSSLEHRLQTVAYHVRLQTVPLPGFREVLGQDLVEMMMRDLSPCNFWSFQMCWDGLGRFVCTYNTQCHGVGSTSWSTALDEQETDAWEAHGGYDQTSGACAIWTCIGCRIIPSCWCCETYMWVGAVGDWFSQVVWLCVCVCARISEWDWTVLIYLFWLSHLKTLDPNIYVRLRYH